MIVFNKHEVIPEVRPDLLPSINDIQVMINFALDRQAKSTDEQMHRLIEERDGKNLMLLVLILLLLLPLLVSLKPIYTQVVHWRVAHQCQTSLSSRWTTFTAKPPSRVRLILLGCHNKLRPACLGKGIHTLRLAFPCQTLIRPHIPLGITVGHTLTLIATTKSRTLP
jgi:hypothetical protein